MHDEILDKKQTKLLPLISEFGSRFGLVGGTAIALHLGHRRSIDFDLFTFKDFDADEISGIIRKEHNIQNVFVKNPNELTILVEGVKITFYKYPFAIDFKLSFTNQIKLPDLVTLGAMKAFALGKRAKWKNYVDLYFIFKTYDLKTIVNEANRLFKGEFNEKLLREQLSYFTDIDHTEEIVYLKGFEVKDSQIEKSLVRVSLQK